MTEWAIDGRCMVTRSALAQRLDAGWEPERAITAPSAANKSKTHCLNNHEFTTENTYIDRNGRRGCKTCAAERRNNG